MLIFGGGESSPVDGIEGQYMRFSKLGPGLLCAATFLWSGASQAQSLEDAAAHLLASHPQIRAGEANVLAAEQGVKRAFSGYLPKVDLRGSYGYEHVDSPARRAVEGTPSSMPAQTASVTVTQNLFNGFRTQAEHSSAETDVQLNEADLESTTQSVLFEGVSSYLDVMRRREQVSLALANVRTIQQQLNLEDERVQRGSGIAVDVLLAKSRLQTAKERLVAFQGEMENAVSRYQQVFDAVPDPGTMVTPDLPVALLPADVNEAIKIALAENPSVKSSNRSVDLADLQKEVARADYYPTLDLVAEYAYEHDLAGVLGPRRDITVGVQAAWEIFSGFATDASVSEAAYLHRASMDNHLFVNRKVVEQVAIAWQNLKTARDRVLLLENAVNIASEVHSSFRQLRDAGQATAFEVLDSQNEIFDAAINLEAAQFDARVAVYQLLQAMGRLTIGNIRGEGDNRPIAEIMRELRMKEEAAANSDGIQPAAYSDDAPMPSATAMPAEAEAAPAADLEPMAGAGVEAAEQVQATPSAADHAATGARPMEPAAGSDMAMQAGGSRMATPGREDRVTTEAEIAPPAMPTVSTERREPAAVAVAERPAAADTYVIPTMTAPPAPTYEESATASALLDSGNLSDEDAALVSRNLQRHWPYE